MNIEEPYREEINRGTCRYLDNLKEYGYTEDQIEIIKIYSILEGQNNRHTVLSNINFYEHLDPDLYHVDYDNISVLIYDNEPTERKKYHMNEYYTFRDPITQSIVTFKNKKHRPWIASNDTHPYLVESGRSSNDAPDKTWKFNNEMRESLYMFFEHVNDPILACWLLPEPYRKLLGLKSKHFDINLLRMTLSIRISLSKVTNMLKPAPEATIWNLYGYLNPENSVYQKLKIYHRQSALSLTNICPEICNPFTMDLDHLPKSETLFDMPTDIGILIMSHLELRDLAPCLRVSWGWYLFIIKNLRHTDLIHFPYRLMCYSCHLRLAHCTCC